MQKHVWHLSMKFEPTAWRICLFLPSLDYFSQGWIHLWLDRQNNAVLALILPRVQNICSTRQQICEGQIGKGSGGDCFSHRLAEHQTESEMYFPAFQHVL